MIKEILKHKAKEYGRELYNHSIKSDIYNMIGVVQGYTETLSPMKRNIAGGVISAVKEYLDSNGKKKTKKRADGEVEVVNGEVIKDADCKIS